jgi:hypothetical protein
MILAGHQPEYLPYIGFFYKVARADKFIFVDHVQFQKKGFKKEFFQNRNRIRTAPGSAGFTWLTVPVITRGKRFQRISEVEIDNSTDWGRKHWRTIFLNYKNTPFFKDYQDFFAQLYARRWGRLADLNETIICYLFGQLEIKIPIHRSSDFNFKGAKTDLLVEMCRELKADTYLSGVGAKAVGYVMEAEFKKQGLNHIFSDFQHPLYPQKYKPFVPNLSVIDLLFNCGRESIKIITR